MDDHYRFVGLAWRAKAWIFGILVGFMAAMAFIGAYQSGVLAKAQSTDSVIIPPEHRQPITSSLQESGSLLSICSQHAPKCPLHSAGWRGETDGWQYTGKKWIWVPGTKNIFNRTVVWEYSQPYSGGNPDYFGQREDHYASCSGSSEDCSLVNGSLPVTYDWERWLQMGENFKVMQLGNFDEDESHLLGEADCSTGIYYPVVDHIQPYIDTSMYNDYWGECIGGGYIAVHLSEMWGEPLSQKRLSMCDNPINGVPTDLSPVGNTICKVSPFVGIIYQRYNFSAPDSAEIPLMGCEAVLYAWGWEEPQAPNSVQRYQSWFRNGELRFTRWYGLSTHVAPGNPPAPDDHAWWDTLCQNAWTEEGNWLYTGTFRAGNAEYTDQAALQTPNIAEIPPSGTTLTIDEVHASFIFPAGSFTDTIQIVEYIPDQEELPAMPGKFKVGMAYRIFAQHPDSLEIVTPTIPYSVTLHYTDDQVGSAESSLGLYWWNGRVWVREASSTLNIANNVLSANPDHFSLWALLADSNRVFLPHVLLSR